MDVEKAIIYTGFEEFDKAFELLNTACDKRLGGMNFIKILKTSVNDCSFNIHW
jgi:hypothetical protein